MNSDTESGVDTNSVGGASSTCASDSVRVSGSARGAHGAASSSVNAASATVVPEIELLLKPFPHQAAKRESNSSDRGAADDTEQRTSVGGSTSPQAHSDSQDAASDLTPAVKYLKAPSITTSESSFCLYYFRFSQCNPFVYD